MKLFPEAPYDVDVAIIGGGPAGMSAAVRCRWVKSYRSLPCSVAVFEPGTLGGLAGWRTCSITGPGYRYLGDGLIQRIATDFERYRIPVVPECVVSLHRDKGLFILETDAGTRVRALSVIVATGMRALANERHFLGRGLFVTYMGYEYFPKLIDRVAEAGHDGVVVFGNRKSAHLAEVAKGLETSVPRLTWILDEPEDVPLPELPGEVRRGTLHTVQGEGDEAAGFDAGTDGAPAAPDYEKAAVAGVQGVEWRDESGTIHSLPCSAVLLDYNAWETRTRRPWDDIGLSDNADGFVRIDPWCETATPGVFAAGDITGRYRSTAMALGDGVNAGLSAVRYTYRLKFDYEPNLFAYQSQDRVLSTEESDLPAIPDDAWVVPIGHESAVSSIARTHGLSVDDAPVDSAVTFATLVQRCDADRARAVALVDAWMDAKVVAVHRRGGST